MAPQLTDYELRRLENIKRNDEMMASLKIPSKLSEIESAKRQRVPQSYVISREKTKAKSNEPVVIRTSLRTRGMPPDSTGLSPDSRESSVKISTPTSSPRVLGPLGFGDSCLNDSESDARAFTKAILSLSSSMSGINDRDSKASTRGISDSNFELESLRLEPDNVQKRVVPGIVFDLKLFPTHDLEMIVVGDAIGNVGFWDMKSKEEGDNIHLYSLHSAPVSGILVHPFSLSKVYTSGHDGLVRVMNVDKLVFDCVYSTDDAIYSIAQKPDDVNSIYLGEGPSGVLKMWDERMGKSLSSWKLHEERINSADFNSSNTMIMATSSTDGSACIWDLRKMSAEKSLMLTKIEHSRAVYSAYFSPSGIHLATTSSGDKIGMVSGKNFEDVSMVRHDNGPRGLVCYFRAVWGWDDEHVYVGNLKRGIDVLSMDRKQRLHTLRSEHMTAIPRRFDANPCRVRALAAATSEGLVCVWTPS